jgi:phosphopentomutase
MIAGKEKFTHFRDEGGCEAWVTGKGDSEIAAAAAGQVSWGVDLLFVHLPDVDAAGHASQWMSAGYLAAVRRADEAVGRIVAALPPDMTIILTADHGGHDTAHGSNDPTDVTIPWIIAGPGIATGRPIAGTVRTMDTAATAARVLGIRLSPGTTGTPVAEAFLPRPAAIAGPFPALFAHPGAGPQVTTR